MIFKCRSISMIYSNKHSGEFQCLERIDRDARLEWGLRDLLAFGQSEIQRGMITCIRTILVWISFACRFCFRVTGCRIGTWHT